MLLEEPQLRVSRGVVAIVVETGLPHRHRTIVSEELPELVQPPRVVRARVVRMDAQSRVHARFFIGQAQRLAARVDAGADGDDSPDTGCACALEHGGGRPGARIEVRVSVDQTAGALDAREERRRRLDPRRRQPTGAHTVPGNVCALAERAQDRSCRGRQVRMERDCDGPHAVGEVVEHSVELSCLGVVLRKLPGLRPLDEAVELPHHVPDRLQGGASAPRRRVAPGSRHAGRRASRLPRGCRAPTATRHRGSARSWRSSRDTRFPSSFASSRS